MNETIRNYYKETIKEYNSNVEHISYYNLTKMFSINILELLKLMDIQNYKISTNSWELYDGKDKIIYKINFKNNFYEEWYYYNEFSNMIKYIDSNHYTEWYKYNKNGNEIYFKDSEGLEEWSNYNGDIKTIKTINSENLETCSHYDDNNDLIYYKDVDGLEEWWSYKKENKQLVEYRDSNGYNSWSTFNGNVLIKFKDNGGEYFHKKYDEKGRLIYKKDKDGNIEKYKFDD